jgi:predicted nicotinamide N-methyase
MHSPDARTLELETRLKALLRLTPYDLELRGQQFQLFEVENMEAMLDRLISKGPDHEDVKDDRIPYWVDLWPSAIALAEYLADRALIVPGMEAVELGCGMAVPGIMAGRLGASVLLTDYLDEALDMAEWLWLLNMGRPARLRRIDWRSPDPSLRADLWMGSDIAYEERSVAPLAAAFDRWIRPGDTLLLSEPGRPASQQLNEALELRGFSRETEFYPVTRYGQTYRIAIHRLLRA